MKSRYRHVALFGKTHANVHGVSLDHSRQVLDDVAHFLARRGCDVVVEKDTAMLPCRLTE